MICEYCSKEFVVKRKSYSGRFCSKDCYLFWKKENKYCTRVCEYCGKFFEARSCKSTKCCSRICSDSLRKSRVLTNFLYSKICKKCGKEFETHESNRSHCTDCKIPPNILKDEEFFKKWSPEMAYILGFVVADGTIIVDRFRESLRLRILSTDIEILEKIANVLGVCKIHKNKSRGGTRKQTFYLDICNRRFVQHLIDLGVCPNKSYDMKKLDIPEELFSHFFRGYLDGDGCFSYGNSTRGGKFCHVSWVGACKDYMKWLHDEVNRVLGSGKPKIHVDNKGYYRSFISGKNKVRKLLDYIYNNSSIHLERKFVKYIEAIGLGYI